MPQHEPAVAPAASRGRLTLGRAHDIAEPVLAFLESLPGIDRATPTGSLRRGLDTVGDVHILVAAHQPGEGLSSLCGTAPFPAQRADGAHDTVVLHPDDAMVTVQVVSLGEYGVHLLRRTGSRAHLDTLGAAARQLGGRLDPAGLWLTDRSAPVADEERAIYQALNLPWIPPEVRDGTAELDAAREGRLPHLVEARDIRGDLHMHSHWSDGRDSIEAMVLAALDLGYDYIAITDHSPSSAASRSLTLETVAEQRAEIEGLRRRYPQLRILHGCEVDILEDGRLDFPDMVLARFDIVLASLHEPLGHDGARLLARYEAAMRHPLVSLITHPMNRQVPHRPGYDLDYARFFETARATGTLVEIDGAPGHMDLDGPLAREAVAAGVTLAIDSDGHRAERLGRQMRIGIQLARRGWVPPASVVNTRPVEAVLDQVARKRRGWRA